MSYDDVLDEIYGRKPLSEPVAEPIIGVRGWKIARTHDGRCFLVPIARDFMYWDPDEYGACESDRRPSFHNDSGFYCYPLRYFGRSKRPIPPPDKGLAWGTVEMWGTVIKHRNGYRAQFARPLDIMICPANQSWKTRKEIARSISQRYHCKARATLLPHPFHKPQALLFQLIAIVLTCLLLISLLAVFLPPFGEFFVLPFMLVSFAFIINKERRR